MIVRYEIIQLHPTYIPERYRQDKKFLHEFNVPEELASGYEKAYSEYANWYNKLHAHIQDEDWQQFPLGEFYADY